jgi:hypothetical protein
MATAGQSGVGFCAALRKSLLGNWILGNAQAGWFPNLKPLVKRGILEKEYSTASGRKAYYRLVDTDGTGRALRELGLART